MNALGIQTRHLIKKDHWTDVNIANFLIFNCSETKKKIKLRVIFIFYDLNLAVFVYIE